MTLEELVHRYFPQEQWANALCVARAECSEGAEYPANCVKHVGGIQCGQSSGDATAYGPFGLLDVCWDPDLNTDSPFTTAQWANVMDLEMNVWMASIIWSRHGFRAWTTCEGCNVCSVPGGPIPYPRGLATGEDAGVSDAARLIVGGLVVVGGLAYLWRRDTKGVR